MPTFDHPKITRDKTVSAFFLIFASIHCGPSIKYFSLIACTHMIGNVLIHMFSGVYKVAFTPPPLWGGEERYNIENTFLGTPCIQLLDGIVNF